MTSTEQRSLNSAGDRAQEQVEDIELLERAQQVDKISQLHVIRSAQSQLRKADKKLSDSLKQHLALEGEEELWDNESYERQMKCPVCLDGETTLKGPVGVTFREVGGTRYVDLSALSDEEVVWAARHGLLQLNVRAYNGLGEMTDPVMVRFAQHVHQSSADKLEMVKEEKSDE